MDVEIMSALRSQAWERAKGELKSMLHTYCSACGCGCGEKFKVLSKKMELFISEIEDNGLHE